MDDADTGLADGHGDVPGVCSREALQRVRHEHDQGPHPALGGGSRLP